MKKLVVASNNQDKILEIKQILSPYDIEVVSLKEVGINIDVDETGTTFVENANIKANAIYNIVEDAMVLADDSGLMVEALGGAPGVYSARFAGEHGNYVKNNRKLLEMLNGINEKDRKAKFICAMVLIVNRGKVIEVQGEIEGFICENEMGNNGFGYDPLFYIPEYKMTFAQMDSKLKNKISHRGKALTKLKAKIEELMIQK